jgi:glycosyltransferase involved in cell wall biosynthesis
VLNIKIAIFFTYDYSIKTLKNSGLFAREMKIYNELHKNYGLEFIFITYDENVNISQKDYPQFKFISIYQYISKSKNKFIRILKSFFVPFIVAKDIADVDILHQHQLLGSWVPMLIKFKIKKPLLIRTGYDAYLFSLNNKDILFKSLFYKYLTKISLRFSDLYTVTSHCDYNFLTQKFDTSKVRVVPNWVESSNKLVSKKENKKILMVGRLEVQKNYPMAIEFLKKISSDYELDVFGSGSQFDYLKSRSLDEKLNINFLGNVSHDKLLDIFRKYDYFLTTSNYEGNPKTVLEALSNECLVFAKDIPNHSEIITDGRNGYLFDSVDELVEKFQYVKNNQNVKLRIQNHASKSLKNNELDSIRTLMFEDYNSLTPSI